MREDDIENPDDLPSENDFPMREEDLKDSEERLDHHEIPQLKDELDKESEERLDLTEVPQTFDEVEKAFKESEGRFDLTEVPQTFDDVEKAIKESEERLKLSEIPQTFDEVEKAIKESEERLNLSEIPQTFDEVEKALKESEERFDLTEVPQTFDEVEKALKESKERLDLSEIPQTFDEVERAIKESEERLDLSEVPKSIDELNALEDYQNKNIIKNSIRSVMRMSPEHRERLGLSRGYTNHELDIFFSQIDSPPTLDGNKAKPSEVSNSEDPEPISRNDSLDRNSEDLKKERANKTIEKEMTLESDLLYKGFNVDYENNERNQKTRDKGIIFSYEQNLIQESNTVENSSRYAEKLKEVNIDLEKKNIIGDVFKPTKKEIDRHNSIMNNDISEFKRENSNNNLLNSNFKREDNKDSKNELSIDVLKNTIKNSDIQKQEFDMNKFNQEIINKEQNELNGDGYVNLFIQLGSIKKIHKYLKKNNIKPHSERLIAKKLIEYFGIEKYNKFISNNSDIIIDKKTNKITHLQNNVKEIICQGLYNIITSDMLKNNEKVLSIIKSKIDNSEYKRMSYLLNHRDFQRPTESYINYLINFVRHYIDFPNDREKPERIQRKLNLPFKTHNLINCLNYKIIRDRIDEKKSETLLKILKDVEQNNFETSLLQIKFKKLIEAYWNKNGSYANNGLSLRDDFRIFIKNYESLSGTDKKNMLFIYDLVDNYKILELYVKKLINEKSISQNKISELQNLKGLRISSTTAIRVRKKYDLELPIKWIKEYPVLDNEKAVEFYGLIIKKVWEMVNIDRENMGLELLKSNEAPSLEDISVYGFDAEVRLLYKYNLSWSYILTENKYKMNLDLEKFKNLNENTAAYFLSHTIEFVKQKLEDDDIMIDEKIFPPFKYFEKYHRMEVLNAMMRRGFSPISIAEKELGFKPYNWNISQNIGNDAHICIERFCIEYLKDLGCKVFRQARTSALDNKSAADFTIYRDSVFKEKIESKQNIYKIPSYISKEGNEKLIELVSIDIFTGGSLRVIEDKCKRGYQGKKKGLILLSLDSSKNLREVPKDKEIYFINHIKILNPEEFARFLGFKGEKLERFNQIVRLAENSSCNSKNREKLAALAKESENFLKQPKYFLENNEFIKFINEKEKIYLLHTDIPRKRKQISLTPYLERKKILSKKGKIFSNIENIVKRLHLSSTLEEKAKEFIEISLQNNFLIGRKDLNGIAACSIYLASKSIKENIDLKKVKKVANITRNYIYRKSKIIAEFIPLVFEKNL